jgi:hypothetical protein
LVQALVAQAWSTDSLTARRETVMSAQQLRGAEHLRRLSVDRAAGGSIVAMLRAYAERDMTNQHGVTIARDALDVVATNYEQTSEVLQGLSLHECGLIAVDADRSLQNACLEAFVDRYRVTEPFAAPAPAHGTFGALPWWSVVVDADACAQVESVLSSGTGFLSLRHDAGASCASLHLYAPDGEHFYTCAYELDSAADLCELLALGRRARLGIDFFVAAPHGSAEYAGSGSVAIQPDVAEELVSLATFELRAIAGGGGLVAHDVAYTAIERELARPANRRWSRPASSLREAIGTFVPNFTP